MGSGRSYILLCGRTWLLHRGVEEVGVLHALPFASVSRSLIIANPALFVNIGIENMGFDFVPAMGGFLRADTGFPPVRFTGQGALCVCAKQRGRPSRGFV